MLENRDYMRERDSQPPWRFRWSAVVTLMIVLTVSFALQCINDVYIHSAVEIQLALTPEALRSGFVWQFLTFQFLHVNLWHLLGNLMGLWFVVQFVENILGRSRFLLAYFGAGVLGGLLQCVLMLAFPRHFAPFVFGASAGIMGIFAIFARLLGDSTIRLNFILPVRADVLLWITGGISLFFTLVPSDRAGGTAHAAHLGGLLAGIAWVKLGWHRDYVLLPWEGWLQRIQHWNSLRRHRMRVVPTRAGKNSDRPSVAGPPDEDLTTDEFVKSEVDPILDKISRQGIQSLTERERQILEKARSRMAKR